MHYRNGRAAKEGDQVIAQTSRGTEYQRTFVGTIHSLSAGSDTCNGQVATIVPGGVSQACINVKDCIHVDDAVIAFNKANPS